MAEPDWPRPPGSPPGAVLVTVLTLVLAGLGWWWWSSNAPGVDRTFGPVLPTAASAVGSDRATEGARVRTPHEPARARAQLPDVDGLVWQVARRLSPGQPIQFYVPAGDTPAVLQVACLGRHELRVSVAQGEGAVLRHSCPGGVVSVPMSRPDEGDASVQLATPGTAPVTVAYQLVRR